jgi:uncharacterized membrane protein
MRAHLRYLWFLATSNLWVVPTAMICAAALLAFGLLQLDTVMPATQLEPQRWLLRIGPEGARQVMATIAGSMITVASLVFSMTLVTLTLASSQLGPRLITRFVRDWVNQVVLGTFVATFVYAILVLQTVSETDPRPFVPHLSVMVGLILALISLLWLVYFIHHVASSIQADTVIAELGEQLSEAIERRFPEIDLPEGGPLEAPFIDRLAEPPGVVAAPQSGYVQAIDARALLRKAAAKGLIVKIDARPGDFVVARAPLLYVWPRERLSDDLAEDLQEPIVIGPKRTPTQDIDFAVAALVEIALRALSPGINDPQTGMTCIDRLTEALAEIMADDEPPSLVPDADGAVRLIVRPATFEGVISAAFNPIRDAGRDHARVLRRLAEALAVLARFTRDESQRETVARQAAATEDACRAAALDPLGRGEVEQSLEALRRALAERQN